MVDDPIALTLFGGSLCDESAASAATKFLAVLRNLVGETLDDRFALTKRFFFLIPDTGGPSNISLLNQITKLRIAIGYIHTR